MTERGGACAGLRGGKPAMGAPKDARAARAAQGRIIVGRAFFDCDDLADADHRVTFRHQTAFCKEYRTCIKESASFRIWQW
ncbi:hypothetical protein PT2222_40251 [Paraburkholderia tropica]